MKYLLLMDMLKPSEYEQTETRRYERCLKYVNEHMNDYEMIFATVHNSKFKSSHSKICYSHEKLEFCNNPEWKSQGEVIENSGYGIGINRKRLKQKMAQDDVIDVIGTDIGVMAAGFELLEEGLNFKIHADYIYSNADICDREVDRHEMLTLLKWIFGEHVIIIPRRIAYDSLFIAPTKKIMYKGKEYEADVALFFQYEYIAASGNEIYADLDDLGTQAPYRYTIDKEMGYIPVKEYDGDGICVSHPDTAYIWINNATPVEIPFEDGVQILKDNFEIYNRTDNMPAQDTAYYISDKLK